jgi:Domain of unknown function (DUF4169)
MLHWLSPRRFAVVQQKLFRENRSTIFAIRLLDGEFHNEDRAGWRISAEFGSSQFNWNPHAFIDRRPRLHNDQTRVTEAAMGDLVNLKQFRKRVAKERSEREAAANRARFGRTRSEREREELRGERASDLLDQHRIDGEDAS